MVVRHALEEQGFTIAGEYAPAEGVALMVVTSPELQKVAAATPFGGFGAAVRVGLTRVGEVVQVSYTNPSYMRAAYRLTGSLTGVATRLEAALGKKRTFGSVKRLTEDELEGYHYMVLMPFFTDRSDAAWEVPDRAALARPHHGQLHEDRRRARCHRGGAGQGRREEVVVDR